MSGLARVAVTSSRWPSRCVSTPCRHKATDLKIDSSCITTDFDAERPGDDTGNSIVEYVAGVDDFEVAEATYRAAVARWPASRITLRQGECTSGNVQLLWTRQLPPAARNREHSVSAASRVSAAMLMRCQIAALPMVVRTTSGSRPPRIA